MHRLSFTDGGPSFRWCRQIIARLRRSGLNTGAWALFPSRFYTPGSRRIRRTVFCRLSTRFGRRDNLSSYLLQLMLPKAALKLLNTTPLRRPETGRAAVKTDLVDIIDAIDGGLDDIGLEWTIRRAVAL